MGERQAERPKIPGGAAEEAREMRAEEGEGRLSKDIIGLCRLGPVRVIVGLAGRRNPHAERVDGPAKIPERLDLASDERVRVRRIIARQIGQPDGHQALAL